MTYLNGAELLDMRNPDDIHNTDEWRNAVEYRGESYREKSTLSPSVRKQRLKTKHLTRNVLCQ